MKVCFGAATDVGRKRKVNQDNYRVGDPSPTKGQLLVVCDGMGGHAAGEVASQLAVDTIMEHYYRSEQVDRTAILEEAFVKANRVIHTQGEGRMGTTGVAALLLHDTLLIANVGDSRAYLLRDAQLTQLSRDHSLVEEQVAAGLLTPDQARNSSYRNMITRALGHLAEVRVDLFKVDAQIGDLVLLSSDGMHGLIEDQEIAQILGQVAPKEAVKRLVKLANERGGPDNITVVVAQIEELEERGPSELVKTVAKTQTVRIAPPAKKNLVSGGLLLAAIALLTLGLWLTFWQGGGKATVPQRLPPGSASPKAVLQTTGLTVTQTFTSTTGTSSPTKLKLPPPQHLTATGTYSREIQLSKTPQTLSTSTLEPKSSPTKKPLPPPTSPTPTSSGSRPPRGLFLPPKPQPHIL